jgi:Fe-S-cluster containining protein
MSDDEVERLQRQLERGGLFTHSALGRSGLRQREVESFVYGLVDVLLARGLIAEDELRDAVDGVRADLDVSGEPPEPAVVLRVDEPQADAEPPVQVDCAARIHICEAVCCKLDFPLSPEEIEGGVVRWDLGRPYAIRQESDGLCSHCDHTTRACGIYEDRPTPCKRYSCAADDRIWTDFDAMELNTEWIAEHLGAQQGGPRLLHAMLMAREDSDAAGAPPDPAGPDSQ